MASDIQITVTERFGRQCWRSSAPNGSRRWDIPGRFAAGI